MTLTDNLTEMLQSILQVAVSVVTMQLTFASMAIMQVTTYFCRFSGVISMLVDLPVNIMQVTVSVGIMQLEVSAEHIQVTVSAANMWVTIFI